MTLEELVAEIEKRDGAMGAQVKGVVDALPGLRDRLASLEANNARGGRGNGIDVLSLGAEFIKGAQDQIDALRERPRGSASLKIKATILSSSTGAGGMVPVDARTDPVILPRRRMTVRQLLSPGRTIGSAIRFVRLESRSNSAGMHSEGQAKAEQTLGFELDSEDVQTIAAWIPASKQILDDAPALASLIDNELRYAVAYKEEVELLTGDGTGTDLHGLIPQATAFSAPYSVDDAQMIDKLLQAKTQLANAEIEADGVVMHPTDWARMASLKDGEGRYIVPGGPFAPYPPTVWGMNLVVTGAISVDTFLCGAFKRAATLYDREEVTVEVSTEHSDFFIRNLVAIRAEERLCLVVSQPEALVTGDFGNVT